MAMLAVTATSCELASSGSGKLIDQGPAAAANRYVLDLGEAGPGKSSFDLEGLPTVELVVGFQISDLSTEEARSAVRSSTEAVSITLTDFGGSPVVERTVLLKDWVWTCGVPGCQGAFAYLREGEGSPGSYFIPRRGESYRLRIELPEVPLLADRRVTVVLRGGGWK